MNNQFDEFTKSVAQSVTRRAALKKFGLGLAGMALACFGLANKAGATTYRGYCQIHPGLGSPYYTGMCMDIQSCTSSPSPDCPTGPAATSKNSNGGFKYSACGPYKGKCSFTI
jgi:hypothetical protein